MHEKLWEGVELKISNAEFFLDQMGIASAVGADFDEYRLPRCAQTNYGTRWQRSFYTHLDAFLAMGRSIPEIINCCFGADLSLAMKSWFNGLDASEKNRRECSLSNSRLITTLLLSFLLPMPEILHSIEPALLM